MVSGPCDDGGPFDREHVVSLERALEAVHREVLELVRLLIEAAGVVGRGHERCFERVLVRVGDVERENRHTRAHQRFPRRVVITIERGGAHERSDDRPVLSKPVTQQDQVLRPFDRPQRVSKNRERLLRRCRPRRLPGIEVRPY